MDLAECEAGLHSKPLLLRLISVSGLSVSQSLHPTEVIQTDRGNLSSSLQIPCTLSSHPLEKHKKTNSFSLITYNLRNWGALGDAKPILQPMQESGQGPGPLLEPAGGSAPLPSAQGTATVSPPTKETSLPTPRCLEEPTQSLSSTATVTAVTLTMMRARGKGFYVPGAEVTLLTHNV